MSELLTGLLVGGGAGGVVGFFLRAYVEEHFTVRREKRVAQRQDWEGQRQGLLDFLGEPRAHFQSLVDAGPTELGEGTEAASGNPRIVAEWVYVNNPLYPLEVRRPMFLITNVAYQLARGDRHFLNAQNGGYERLGEAWETLEGYAEELRRKLQE